jgi:hypothetical protein
MLNVTYKRIISNWMKQHSLPEGLAGLIDCVRLKNRHRFFYLHLRQRYFRYLNKICTVVELLIQSFYGVASVFFNTQQS